MAQGKSSVWQRTTERSKTVWIGLLGGTVLFVLAGAEQQALRQAPDASIPLVGYDELMTRRVDERRALFAEITPENKAMIVRTHAERWLVRNTGRLSGSQVAAFRDIILLIEPELFGRTPDDAREEALRAKMECRVSPDDAMHALSLTNMLEGASKPEGLNPTWTRWSQAKCWLERIAEGILCFVPTVPRSASAWPIP
jgi:hypothetical protein